jgi:anti-anti-sigma factor
LATVEYRDASTGSLVVGVFEDGGYRVIRVGGELDLATVPTLEQELEEAMRPADDAAIVVDLSDLEFIDSTGIAVLVRAMGADNGSSRLRFVPSRARAVNRVLDMTGVAERMALAEGVRE